MPKVIFRVLLAALAAALLASGAGTASARNFSVRGAESGFRFTFNRFEFLMAWNNNRLGAICPVTMEGSFHSRTIAKVVRMLIGYVTRVALSEAACRGFSGPEENPWPVRAEFLAESLPWHMQYNGFTGLLPRISSIRANLIGPAIRVSETAIGWSCLYRASAEVPMHYSFLLREEGVISSFRAESGEQLIPLVSGFACNLEGMNYAGEAAVTALGTTTRLTVTLI